MKNKTLTIIAVMGCLLVISLTYYVIFVGYDAIVNTLNNKPKTHPIESGSSSNSTLSTTSKTPTNLTVTLGGVVYNITREHRSAIWWSDFDVDPIATGEAIVISGDWSWEDGNLKAVLTGRPPNPPNAALIYFPNINIPSCKYLFVEILARHNVTDSTIGDHVDDSDIRVGIAFLQDENNYYATYMTTIDDPYRGVVRRHKGQIVQYVNGQETNILRLSDEMYLVTAGAFFDNGGYYDIRALYNFSDDSLSMTFAGLIFFSPAKPTALLSINYIGLATSWLSGNLPIGVWFDRMVVSVDHPPNIVYVRNLRSGYYVELLDGEGNIVNSGYANATGVAKIDLTGILFVKNAVIRVYTNSSKAQLIASAQFSEVIGGDIYTVYPRPPAPQSSVTDLVLWSRPAVYVDTFQTDPFTDGRVVPITYPDNWYYDSSQEAVVISLADPSATDNPTNYAWCEVNVELPKYGKLWVCTDAWSPPAGLFRDNKGWIEIALARDLNNIYASGTSNYNVLLLYQGVGFQKAENGELEQLELGHVVRGYYDSSIARWTMEFLYWWKVHLMWLETPDVIVITKPIHGDNGNPTDSKFEPEKLWLGACYDGSGRNPVVVIYYDVAVILNALPYFINITNLPSGYYVELYDGSGNLVANATANEHGLASLLLIYYVVIENARIDIYTDSSKSTLVLSKTFPLLVGGDILVYVTPSGGGSGA